MTSGWIRFRMGLRYGTEKEALLFELTLMAESTGRSLPENLGWRIGYVNRMPELITAHLTAHQIPWHLAVTFIFVDIIHRCIYISIFYHASYTIFHRHH
jgi:hypothetical protein